MLKVFSGIDYKQVVAIESLDDADNVRFDPAKERIFVGYAEGALAKVDIGSWKKIDEFKLPAHPESFQLEGTGSRIFANVPGAKQLMVLDREKGVIANFTMEKFQANFPMALDEAHHRLFVGCRRPPRLLVLSTEEGNEMGNTDISGDTDDLFYDAKRDRVYVSCGQGFIDVISVSTNGLPKRIEKVPTRSGARTSLFSAELDRLFVAVPNQGREVAELRMFEPRN